MNDELTGTDIVSTNQEMEVPTEDLLLLAYTGLDRLNQKNTVMPKVTYFLDIMKTLLDTLRSNSRFLEFYNDTTRKVFNFCK